MNPNETSYFMKVLENVVSCAKFLRRSVYFRVCKDRNIRQSGV